jgi:NitT/TauT family transport system permease protein
VRVATESRVAVPDRGLDLGLGRPAARNRAGRTVLTTAGPAVLGVVVAVVAWETWVRVANTPPFILPGPSRVWGRFLDDVPTLFGQLGWTLFEASVGLSFGVLIGILGASLMAHWLLAERALLPLAVVIKVTPVVALVPILVSWIGHNLWPKIIVACLATFFPVLINTITGLRAVDPNSLEFLRSVGANRREIYVRLRWHAALPYLFSALKVSVNMSLIGAIVGEWFGAEVGIGKVIRQTGLKMDMAGMFAGIMMLVMTGCTLMIVLGWIERRVLFWHESARTEGNVDS